MQIEVKIIQQDNANRPESERQSVAVETHSRRGDMFNIDKNDNVLEGSTTTFTVPNGGRLVLTMPQGVNEVVYDRDQAASVKMANQANAERVADKPGMPPDRPATSGVTQTPPTKPTPAPVMTPSQPTTHPTRVHPGPVEAAKAAQQTTAGRPDGEKPPLPGSPVGSPPAGNEGKDNK